MHDGAPVLPCSYFYLLYIDYPSVEVAAIKAVHLFNGIKAAEVLTVQLYNRPSSSSELGIPLSRRY